MSFILTHLAGCSCVLRSFLFFPLPIGTHASLSTKHTNFEEKVYHIPIRINDGGRPPLEGTVSLPGMHFAVGSLG